MHAAYLTVIIIAAVSDGAAAITHLIGRLRSGSRGIVGGTVFLAAVTAPVPGPIEHAAAWIARGCADARDRTGPERPP